MGTAKAKCAWRKLFGTKISGSKRAARAPCMQAAYLECWKSNIILQYAEEALETMPVMARPPRNTCTPPTKTELITKAGGAQDSKAVEKIKETGI